MLKSEASCNDQPGILHIVYEISKNKYKLDFRISFLELFLAVLNNNINQSVNVLIIFFSICVQILMNVRTMTIHVEWVAGTIVSTGRAPTPALVLQASDSTRWDDSVSACLLSTSKTVSIGIFHHTFLDVTLNQRLYSFSYMGVLI